MTLYTDSIFLTDDVEGFRECRETRSTTSMAMILCEAGHIDVVLNGRTIRIGPNDLFVRIPTFGAQLGPYEYSADYRFRQLTVAETVFEELILDHMRIEPRWYEKLEYLRSNPVFHLSSVSIEYCRAYFQLLSLQLRDRQRDNRRQILMSIARAATMEMLNYLDRMLIPSVGPDRASTNQSDYTFSEFMHLLQQNPYQREVQWFAAQLGITPKYLSEISKARSGKSASDWIADITVSEIKQRLRSSTAPIRDVALEMGFPNASFFCQYTKKHTGFTPNRLRKQKHS